MRLGWVDSSDRDTSSKTTRLPISWAEEYSFFFMYMSEDNSGLEAS